MAVQVAVVEVHDEQPGDGDDVHENEEPIGERIQSYCYNWGVPKKLEIWHFEMKSGGPVKRYTTVLLHSHHHLSTKISFFLKCCLDSLFWSLLPGLGEDF